MQTGAGVVRADYPERMIEVLKAVGVEAWVALTYGVVLLVALPAWAWYYENYRECPVCRRHRLKHVDRAFCSVDGGSRRSLFRCRACGSDLVRYRRRWIARRDWTDPLDREIWARIDAERESKRAAVVAKNDGR